VRAHQAWRTAVKLSVGRESAGINRLWARRKIAALMDERTRGAAETEVREKVLEVALGHHLVSKYTSLVAVDVTPTRPADAGLKSGAVPTNLPAGWQHEKVFGHLPKGGTPGRLHLLIALIALALAASLRGLRGGA
jgi:Ca-activated chloride channel family protein